MKAPKPVQMKVLDSLNRYYSQIENNNSEKQECWLNTRIIADLCELNIYQARYVLLKLLALGYVERQRDITCNSLEWRPIKCL